MKVCVYGAGAVGGYLAARLGSVPGVELSLVTRGPHLSVIRQSGLRVEAPDGDTIVRPATATDQPENLPAQDIVFVTLKSMGQASVVEALRRLVGDGGHAVFCNNGIPWWWNHGTATPGPLPLLDAGNALWNNFGPERVLGCVVHSSNEVVAPGVVRHKWKNRWVVGEPDNSTSERLVRTVNMMQAGGVGAEVSTDLRREVFAKLLLNAAYNPICAVTGLAMEWLVDEPALVALVHAICDETVAVAAALGIDVSNDLSAVRKMRSRPEGLTFAQGQKPSMLQDVLSGRPMEIEAILGQLCAFADDKRVPCPHAKTLLALLRGLQSRVAMAAY